MLLPDEREVMNEMTRRAGPGQRWFNASELNWYHEHYRTFMRIRRMREASRVRQQKFIVSPFSSRRGTYPAPVQTGRGSR